MASEGKGQHSAIEIDPKVAEAFMRGDLAAYKTVYSKFRQKVLSYCLYYMGSTPSAEDAFQEVFTRVYTHRQQLREPKALTSWILLITRSVCLNSLRTSKFAPDFVSINQHNAEGEEYELQTTALSVEPVNEFIVADALQAALKRLAPMHRDAFLLREFEGYEYEEIAKITETSVMNVKVRITRAKKQLRELLAPNYPMAQSARPKGREPSSDEEVPDETDGTVDAAFGLQRANQQSYTQNRI